MDLRTYQDAVSTTDCLGAAEGPDPMVPLLGLAGEVGELQAEYKKAIRDGGGPDLYRDRFAEELGDVLWYVANLATKLGFDLEEIAERNLGKARERWGQRAGLASPGDAFDEGHPECERLPRKLRVLIKTGIGPGGEPIGQAYVDSRKLGDHLTDNAYVRDGYRFHDTFHFAFAAVLGWSPITRWFLNRKRKSRPAVDVVEDGARAKAAEEAISLFVFSHARSTTGWRARPASARRCSGRSRGWPGPWKWPDARPENGRTPSSRDSPHGGSYTTTAAASSAWISTGGRSPPVPPERRSINLEWRSRSRMQWPRCG